MSQDITDDRYAGAVLPPLSEQINSDHPPAPNGSAQSFAQQQQQDSIHDNWHAYETGMFTDDYAYQTTAVAALSDRPAKLGYAPMPNGYIGWPSAFAQ